MACVRKKRTLILRPKAQQDIAKGDHWYEEKSHGLGDRFLLDVQRCLAQILDNHKGFQLVHEEFRQAPLDRFPHVVVYRTDGSLVVIMRIFHTSQNPKKKFKRKK